MADVITRLGEKPTTTSSMIVYHISFLQIRTSQRFVMWNPQPISGRNELIMLALAHY
jgi:hypothetical protein